MKFGASAQFAKISRSIKFVAFIVQKYYGSKLYRVDSSERYFTAAFVRVGGDTSVIPDKSKNSSSK